MQLAFRFMIQLFPVAATLRQQSCVNPIVDRGAQSLARGEWPQLGRSENEGTPPTWFEPVADELAV